MASIRLKNVCKSWGEELAVDQVNIEIADQEFVVLLGPSGCGKTTTMRMIAGLTELSDGEIWIDDEMVNDVDARFRDVAMVFQSYALYPNMSIYQNIRFPLRMRGIPKAEHESRVMDAARMVELEPYLHRKPGALSGGQRQRAALARAIVRHPRLFLMDEPLSNLDAKLRTSMRLQLKHVQRKLKITTVYVTHDQIEAMTLADRIVIMNEGRVQQVGTPDEIYNQPNHTFVASFIGSPPMNLISGEINQNAFMAPGIHISGLPDACQEFAGQSITLGIRPEDISVVTMDGASIKGTLFGIEPTGDITYLSVRTPDDSLEVKVNREFRQEPDTPIGLSIDSNRLFLFDAESGNRLLGGN